MDKNQHNYNAGVADGRKQFAREVEMLIDSLTAEEAPDEEILDAVEAKVNNELS
jgi:hypothetical protein